MKVLLSSIQRRTSGALVATSLAALSDSSVIFSSPEVFVAGLSFANQRIRRQGKSPKATLQFELTQSPSSSRSSSSTRSSRTGSKRKSHDGEARAPRRDRAWKTIADGGDLQLVHVGADSRRARGREVATGSRQQPATPNATSQPPEFHVFEGFAPTSAETLFAQQNDAGTWKLNKWQGATAVVTIQATPGDLPYAQCEEICRSFGSDCGSFNYVNAPPLTTRTFVDHATGWQTTTLPAAASCTFFRADALAFAALSNNTGDRFAVRPASLDLSTTAFPGGGDSSTQAGSKFCYDGTIDFATVTFVNDFGTGPLDAAGIANGAAQPTAVNRTEGYKLDSTLLVLEENTNSAVVGEPHSWYQFPSEQHCKLACTKAAKCQGVFFETASKKCTLYSLCATKPLATGFLTGKGFFRALTKASNAETGGLMALYHQKLLAEEKEFVAKLPLAKSGLGSDVTFHCDVGETSQFALQRWMYVLDPDDGAGSNLKVDGVADVKECLDSCLQVQNCRGFNYHVNGTGPLRAVVMHPSKRETQQVEFYARAAEYPEWAFWKARHCCASGQIGAAQTELSLTGDWGTCRGQCEEDQTCEGFQYWREQVAGTAWSSAMCQGFTDCDNASTGDCGESYVADTEGVFFRA